MKRLIPNCPKSIFGENETSVNSGSEMWLLQSTLHRISLSIIVASLLRPYIFTWADNSQATT